MNSEQTLISTFRTSLALMVYREAIVAGTTLTMEVVSQVLGCLQLPYVADTRDRLVENLGVSTDSARRSNLCSLIDGFGEYDPRAFSLLEVCGELKYNIHFLWICLYYVKLVKNYPRLSWIDRKLLLLELFLVYPSKKVLLLLMQESWRFILLRWVWLCSILQFTDPTVIFNVILLS